jgi:hypothetical protein
MWHRVAITSRRAYNREWRGCEPPGREEAVTMSASKAEREAVAAKVAALLAAAASADRDADGEWPGSYYRKAHRARARRLRRKAEALVARDREEES